MAKNSKKNQDRKSTPKLQDLTPKKSPKGGSLFSSIGNAIKSIGAGIESTVKK